MEVPRKIICVHGAAGAGKTTMLQMVRKILGDRVLIRFEEVDQLWKTKSYRRRSSSVHILSTTMVASEKLIQMNNKRVPLFLILLFALIYLLIHTNHFLLLMILFMFCSMPFVVQFLASHLLSKLWNYYSNHYVKSREITTPSVDSENNQIDVSWTWFDRSCVDIYGFCCIDQPVTVPNDFLTTLEDQTTATNVAVILDTPKNIICRHLAARFCGQQATTSMRIVTKLLIKIPFMVQTTLQALPLIENWYYAFNIPVIKISQLYSQLDKDEETEEILWTENSITILMNTIEKIYEQKQPITEEQIQLQQQLKAPWLPKIRKDDCVH